jgi:hypothetical protein
MESAYSPIPELNLLKTFQNRTGFEEYAAGFGLSDYDDKSPLEAAWSKEPEFLGRLIPFAQANGSGSFYALWRVDDRVDLATLPVVVFGDEGGQHIVARNLPELFQLLGADMWFTIDHYRCYYYFDEGDDDDEHRPHHDDFVAWLAEHFGLRPADDPDAVLAAAQAEYGERFTNWWRNFLRDR